MRQTVANQNGNRFISKSMFGKKTVSRKVTNIYLNQDSIKNKNEKGYVFTRKYDGEVYGYQVFDLADMNQLIALITQKCTVDRIVVKTQKEESGTYAVSFEVNI